VTSHHARRVAKWMIATTAALVSVVAAIVWHPYLVVSPLSGRERDVLFFVPKATKVVALSIDDAPSPATEHILTALKLNNAKATFFIIGHHARADSAGLARIAAAGHELGNHLYTDRASARLSIQEFATELKSTDTIIRKYQRPKWFRPGSGWYTRAMLDTAKTLGYRCVLGSVYPFDPHIRSASFSRRFIEYTVRPGSIIILHDGPERGMRTARVLSELLPRLRADGYRVVSIGDLVGAPTS
jgi:peptidoglycan-N-acetylglucosamine deacetylase